MDKKTKVKKTIPDTICRVHRSGGYAVLSNCFVRSTNIGCDSIGAPIPDLIDKKEYDKIERKRRVRDERTKTRSAATL